MCDNNHPTVDVSEVAQVIVAIGFSGRLSPMRRGVRHAASSRVRGGAPEKGCSTWLASADPRKTGYGFTTRGADAALMQRLRQGLRERDGQERATRWTASLMGTWSGQHRSGSQMETGDSYGHPAEPMGTPE